MKRYSDDQMLIYRLNNQKDCFRLLIMLWNEGSMYGSRIQKLGMNDRTLIKVRELLVQLKVVKVSSSEGSRRLYYELTKKGKKVIDKLIDLERELLIE